MDVIRRSIIFCLLFISFQAFPQGSPEELFSMSFEELMNLKVTTAAKYETSLSETHAVIQVIFANEIKAYGIENLGELLNLIKGFYITNDRNYTYIGVQGFSRPSDYNNRLLLMIDNHVLNENVYGSALMDNGLGIDLQFIDRVEVIAGPGAALYGNSAMMAVVNVITVAESKNENKLRLKTGGNNTLGAGFVSRGKQQESSWFVSGNVHRSSGENLFFNELVDQGNGGHATGLDDEKVYALYTRYNLKNFGLKLSGSHRLKGIPTGPWGYRLDRRSESVDDRAFAELNYQKSFSNQSVKLLASWDYYRYWGEYASPDVADYEDESVGSWGNVQMEYQIDFAPKSRLMAGAEWHYSLKSDYMEKMDWLRQFYRNNRFRNTSLFVQYDYILNDKMRFLAGLRLDDYSYTKLSLNPRLSAIYAPNEDLNIKLSFNKAFRAPNFYEMFYESEGANTSNPDLRHENMYYSDLDIRNKFTKDLHGGVSIFMYRLDKLIDPVVDDQNVVMFVNKSDATGTGGQLYCEGKLFNNLTIHTSYSYQRLTIHDSGLQDTEASNFPVNSLKAHVIYHVPKIGTLGFQNGWESGRKWVTEGKTPAYWTSSLNLRTARFFDRVTFSLKINNLFDQVYYHPGGFEHRMGQIIQPRRNYLLSVGINL
ncbi:TonB-dependent receptor plug domain-containing protein [Gaoshiqia sp. Z1-71]|uniref:TonB-dependent receptor plug domain-containing protein n=1 Tax=Gaoshiqia hydrogeniformans TaxID=3290090 RepID=UPI003BF8BB11